MNPFDGSGIRSLLRMHSSIGNELRARGICRTANNPAGDVAEHLFSVSFGWTLEGNSQAGYDAVCKDLGRIQIKCRRVTPDNPSRQAGDIRDLDGKKFDWLAGVVFNGDWDIVLAMLIPHALVVKRAIPIAHSRSSRIYLREDWLSLEAVVDVTTKLRESWRQIAGPE